MDRRDLARQKRIALTNEVIKAIAHESQNMDATLRLPIKPVEVLFELRQLLLLAATDLIARPVLEA